ncbi:hypothetical protein [Virgibacillus dakarensis]|uniref:hypothetical protein n=1 Tax=Virgibacillus dakarensis TaxID=1917889 RepID=UPI001122FF5D|nr:hypothetical protein [Virgibacillus dakarensis]
MEILLKRKDSETGSWDVLLFPRNKEAYVTFQWQMVSWEWGLHVFELLHGHHSFWWGAGVGICEENESVSWIQAFYGWERRGNNGFFDITRIRDRSVLV